MLLRFPSNDSGRKCNLRSLSFGHSGDEESSTLVVKAPKPSNIYKKRMDGIMQAARTVSRETTQPGVEVGDMKILTMRTFQGVESELFARSSMCSA